MENLEVERENCKRNFEELGSVCDKVNGKNYSYDEAVELTGHGRYNFLLLIACSIISNAVALDMFGFGVVLAAATCDLQLGMAETGLLASSPFAGLLFAFPWGYYSDTRGRRRALLLSTSVGFVMAALSSLSPNWQAMLAFKLIGCGFSTAAFTLTMTYLGECTGSKHRSQYLSIMNSINLASEAISFVLAYFLLPLDFSLPITWLSITYRPWRLLTLIMSVPLGLGALMVVFFYESPKFLANSGQKDKALKVLWDVYEVNGGKKENFPVRDLTLNNVETNGNKESFVESIVKQTVPIFQSPLLWRTMQLFYLFIVCCSTNNVFVMWFPKMVNSLFTSLSEGSIEDMSFCQRVMDNITDSNGSDTPETTCVDILSPNTIYSGIIYGLFFTLLNLVVSKLAYWRRLVLMATFLVSALSAILVDLLKWPMASLIFFTLLQGTSIAIGIVASYFVDLYPTSYRGLATSLGMMVARLASFTGVNIVGAIIVNNCSWTFYGWSIFVFSGVAVAWFLPAEKQIKPL